ncbi:hypothetical protein GvMRE_Ic5g33 [endosymbiont GvMRE of Glomus versiforme]|nr:hypothetical protein GvMRE_Ic5g33 [endosymbiont GvMRE of Glomus versiforme]
MDSLFKKLAKLQLLLNVLSTLEKAPITSSQLFMTWILFQLSGKVLFKGLDKSNCFLS